MSELDIPTPHGPARAHLHPVDGRARGALILGHGAGGGVTAPDLVAARRTANEHGWHCALNEQPYRVAGRKAPAPQQQLDVAFVTIVRALSGRGKPFKLAPVVTGGRSMGSRVACRTAQEVGARGVLCLAFPLVPPRRRADGNPPPSRLPELKSAGVPVLVIQGEGDPFGMPPRGAGRRVVRLAGDHGLKKDIPGLRAALGRWLDELEL